MTMRQLIISAVGGGIDYMIYLTLEQQPMMVWLPPVALLGLLVAAIAFLRINDIPFTQYFLYALERYLLETKRYWIKGTGDIYFHEPLSAAGSVEKPTIAPRKTELTTDDLDRISRTLDATDARDVVKTTPHV